MTDLYAVAITTDKWRFHHTNVDADSPVTVDILHGANATNSTTHMMLMDRQRNARVTPTSHQCKCYVTFQDVKVPCDYTAFLCHLHQNLQRILLLHAQKPKALLKTGTYTFLSEKKRT